MPDKCPECGAFNIAQDGESVYECGASFVGGLYIGSPKCTQRGRAQAALWREAVERAKDHICSGIGDCAHVDDKSSLDDSDLCLVCWIESKGGE